MSKHAAVWLDHKEAHIFHITEDSSDKTTIMVAPHHVHHKHGKGYESTKDHHEEAKRFHHDIATSLEGSKEILVVGPSTAKLEFIRYVHKHDHALEPKIVGIETVDHPTDGQLVAYAKSYFKLSDRMR